MAEHVQSAELGVVWDPNAPDAVLLSGDNVPTVLALRAHPDDDDQRCVVLIWEGSRFVSMTPPNDEAISAHRLWGKGLRDVLWAGVVGDSELIGELEHQNRVHPLHTASRSAELAHHVIRLKECVVEVVARTTDVRRASGTTIEAATGTGQTS